MKKQNKSTITVQGTDVSIFSQGGDDFISLTDIARFKNAEHSDDVIRNWLRNRNTLEFLGIWERLNNPDFKPVEFDGFRIQAGLNSFTLTPKQWVERTMLMKKARPDIMPEYKEKLADLQKEFPIPGEVEQLAATAIAEVLER